MSAGGEVLRVRREGGVVRLVLNRPEKRNALNAELVEALKAALREADADPETRVVALEGAGKDFCSGADLSALRTVAEGGVMENLEDVEGLAELFLLPRRMRRPVVALVRGRALAGGCGLATACDLVLAAEGAQLGYPEVRIGFVPAMVMAILRRNVGEKRAFELIVDGRPITAAEAERIGLVNRVVPDDRFAEEADAWLAELAGRSASAVQLSKRLLYHSDAMGFEAAVRAGADLNVLARMTDDMQAGVRRFLEGAR
ncbi:MAG TPA: enoyl-CoA hydratase/isomerase family protein [Longimicrobiaceae bacterium]|nr:enoyl-CoA hydratase/isomerase family protein [Longimicrobiaceae bacterium]